MLSAIFVDRPRLAIVIAIVTALPASSRSPQSRSLNTRTSCPPGVRDDRLSGAIRRRRWTVASPSKRSRRRRQDDLHEERQRRRWQLHTDRIVRTRHRSRYQHRQRQQSRADCPLRLAARGSTPRRHREKRSSALLGAIAFYSPKHSHDPLFLSNYVTINLLDRIKSMPGVGDAMLWGPQDYAMRAWIRTDRLTGLGLTVGDIISTIQSQNTQAAVGRIGARPISDDQQLQLNIQTKGRLASVAEFENIVVRTNPDGSVLRLGDVARLELGAANLDRDTRFNGGPAAVVAIFQTPGANAIRTLNDVRARVSELAKSFPDDMAWKVTYDPTASVTATIEEVQRTLIEAFILVVLVVYLFLGSVRATLIPTLAVPVSLIGTFIVLKAIGYSANTVSLLAVVLAIGIVVDDAIVVVENVERVMEEHPELSPGEAAKRAMTEITGPIIAITLVLLSVFVPIAFIPGISGELFRQFAVTVSVSMLLSAVNALTLSPALCGVLLRPHYGPRRGVIGRIMRSIDRVRDAYGVAVAHIVQFSAIGLVMVIVAGAGVIGLNKMTPTGFLPEDDQGTLFVVDNSRRRIRRTDHKRGPTGRGHSEEGRSRRGLHFRRRTEFHRQLLPVERRLSGGDVETV